MDTSFLLLYISLSTFIHNMQKQKYYQYTIFGIACKNANSIKYYPWSLNMNWVSLPLEFSDISLFPNLLTLRFWLFLPLQHISMQNHNSNLTVNGSKVYKSTVLKWHYYFMGRTSVCPVVLTENGYMTNKYDFNNVINMNVNNAKAKAITAGIAEYFLSIQ